MIHLICDICGKDYRKTPDIFYQVFIQEVTNARTPNKSICVCRNCMPKQLLRSATPMLDLADNPNEPHPNSSESPFKITDEPQGISQTLREFLDSNYYMNATHSFQFFTPDQTQILELTQYMDWNITHIYPENGDGCQNIMLKPHSENILKSH